MPIFWEASFPTWATEGIKGMPVLGSGKLPVLRNPHQSLWARRCPPHPTTLPSTVLPGRGERPHHCASRSPWHTQHASPIKVNFSVQLLRPVWPYWGRTTPVSVLGPEGSPARGRRPEQMAP